MRALLPLMLLLAAPAWADDPPPFRRWPYLQAVGPDRATVLWEPAAPGPARLVVRGPQAFERSVAVEPAPGLVRAEITGLKPGVRYRYEVIAGDVRLEGRLVTQPPPGYPFSFVVYGDNRSDHQAHDAVIRGMMAADPDFLVNTGDLVERGDVAGQWDVFFGLSARLLRDVPLYPVLGNHEVVLDGVARFRAAFELPGNEAYYHFDWGNLRFVAIDANIHVDPLGGPDPAQLEYLLRVIAEGEKAPHLDHVIGFVHQGPFSSHPFRPANAGLRAALPKLQDAGLDLLLSGHDHFYERGVSTAGLPYMVIGSGGAPLYPTRGPGRYEGYTAIYSRSVHAFVRLRSTAGLLRGCAVDLDGVAIDCFEMGRPAVGSRDRTLR